jgi:hypothetical protein
MLITLFDILYHMDVGSVADVSEIQAATLLRPWGWRQVVFMSETPTTVPKSTYLETQERNEMLASRHGLCVLWTIILKAKLSL